MYFRLLFVLHHEFAIIYLNLLIMHVSSTEFYFDILLLIVFQTFIHYIYLISPNLMMVIFFEKYFIILEIKIKLFLLFIILFILIFIYGINNASISLFNKSVLMQQAYL